MENLLALIETCRYFQASTGLFENYEILEKKSIAQSLKLLSSLSLQSVKPIGKVYVPIMEILKAFVLSETGRSTKRFQNFDWPLQMTVILPLISYEIKTQSRNYRTLSEMFDLAISVLNFPKKIREIMENQKNHNSSKPEIFLAMILKESLEKLNRHPVFLADGGLIHIIFHIIDQHRNGFEQGKTFLCSRSSAVL